MNRKRFLTVYEAIMVVMGAVSLILLVLMATDQGIRDVSWTPHGFVVESCVNGTVLLQGESGTPIQKLDADGKPESCHAR